MRHFIEHQYGVCHITLSAEASKTRGEMRSPEIFQAKIYEICGDMGGLSMLTIYLLLIKRGSFDNYLKQMDEKKVEALNIII